jgi:nitrogen regulatory protein P-II 1
MKEIKAFLHPHRISAVTEALRASGLCDLSAGTGCYNLTVSNVQRLFTSSVIGEQRYSLDLAEPVVAEAKLELICDDTLVDQLVALISKAGAPGPGWVFTTDIQGSVQVV